MKRFAYTSLVVLGPFLLSNAGCIPSDNHSTEQTFREYIAASNAHDFETLAALTSADIVWRLGPHTFEGKEEALRPHFQDSLLNTSLDVRDVEVRGDTIEFTLIERNDAARIHGLDSLVAYPRFVFDHGLLVLKEFHRPSPDYRSLSERAQPFRAWVGQTHGEAMAIILDSTGAPTWSREALVLTHSFLAEWVALGKPGA